MKPKLISIEAYDEKMQKIIKKNMSINDTLIALLNEACKWDIKEKSNPPKCACKQRHGGCC